MVEATVVVVAAAVEAATLEMAVWVRITAAKTNRPPSIGNVTRVSTRFSVIVSLTDGRVESDLQTVSRSVGMSAGGGGGGGRREFLVRYVSVHSNDRYA